MSGRYAAVVYGYIVALSDTESGVDMAAWFDTQGMNPAPQVGWLYNGDGTFRAPPPPPVSNTFKLLSKNQMRRHLFANAPSMTPTVWATLFDGTGDANVKLFAQAFLMAETISCPNDPADPAAAADTAQGLAILVAEGKILATERDAVVANWPKA